MSWWVIRSAEPPNKNNKIFSLFLEKKKFQKKRESKIQTVVAVLCNLSCHFLRLVLTICLRACSGDHQNSRHDGFGWTTGDLPVQRWVSGCGPNGRDHMLSTDLIPYPTQPFSSKVGEEWVARLIICCAPGTCALFRAFSCRNLLKLNEQRDAFRVALLPPRVI